MKTRKLAGRDVGAVGLGCMSFGGMYGPTDEETSHATLARALELGIDHWDVANVYGMGLSEKIMGSFLRENPADVSIATKAGIFPKPERHFKNDRDSLRAELEGSLERLGRSSVELFYIHRREQARPVEEVVETLAGFIEEGLIGSYGLSEVAPGTLRRAAAVHPCAAVQSEYSLWTRQPELGMVQACAELGTTFVAFSPVGRGIFAETFPDADDFHPGDFRTNNPRFTEPNYALNKAAIAPFRDWCHARGWTVPAVAIAWTLARGQHVLPIPGTRTVPHLEQLAAGAEIELTTADLVEIERILPVGFAHGGRYTESQTVGVEQYC
ncbi:aldo/keto reductase [Rhodobacterales bacterium HKCCE2091]|nr:aldo/keto reductase [Rhodobacterales bacterium HKCCE2091]